MEHQTTNVNSILRDRAKHYGKYSVGVECRAQILDALNMKYKETHKEDMPEYLRIMFTDLALKLMRAASDPTHKDSWIDLEGYAKIIKGVMVDGKK